MPDTRRSDMDSPDMERPDDMEERGRTNEDGIGSANDSEEDFEDVDDLDEDESEEDLED